MFGKKPIEPPPEPEEPTIPQQVVENAQTQKRVEEMLGEGQTPFAKFMLESENLPPALTKLIPLFTDKEFSLTNITSKEQLEMFMLFFDDVVNDYHLFTPHYEQTPEVDMLIGQMRAFLYARLLKSTGGKLRERALFVTAITAQEKQEVRQTKGGLFSRVKSKVL